VLVRRIGGRIGSADLGRALRDLETVHCLLSPMIKRWS
jgi:hypothetical protein